MGRSRRGGQGVPTCRGEGFRVLGYNLGTGVGGLDRGGSLHPEISVPRFDVVWTPATAWVGNSNTVPES